MSGRASQHKVPISELSVYFNDVKKLTSLGMRPHKLFSATVNWSALAMAVSKPISVGKVAVMLFSFNFMLFVMEASDPI